MTIVQLLGHCSGGLGHGVNDVLVEDDFGAGKFLPGIANPPISDLACPSDEIGPFLERVKLFADDDAGILQKIFGVVAIGDDSVDVSENLPLMLCHQRQQALAILCLVI